jgi:hypothetical protein
MDKKETEKKLEKLHRQRQAEIGSNQNNKNQIFK